MSDISFRNSGWFAFAQVTVLRATDCLSVARHRPTWIPACSGSTSRWTCSGISTHAINWMRCAEHDRTRASQVQCRVRSVVRNGFRWKQEKVRNRAWSSLSNRLSRRRMGGSLTGKEHSQASLGHGTQHTRQGSPDLSLPTIRAASRGVWRGLGSRRRGRVCAGGRR